ncbi:MAG TPA: DUF2079 domain-containing protein, partial [Candidatus Omnitrophota bacterium]|nr:DUF2079 domain-containing protein [Candidatus Omnitrophota bacterium]
MTNKPQTYELKFHIINMLLVTAATLTLFILFTNLLPLVQAGWIKSLGKKTRYVNLMAAAVSIFTALMILVRWKTPTLFDRTWPVLVWKKLCRLHPALTASIFFLLYTAVMTWTGFERQEALETRAFDLGIFVQAVWNTLHGDFLFSSIKENINLLGDHVSPILALLTPAYALWPDPKALILIQAIAAASCMFPLAYLAQERLKDRFWAVIFVLMYFFYQPTRAALHEDFHPEVLIETFLILAFIFLEHRKKLPFLLSLLVAVSAKENILGIAFMLGFYALVWKRMPALGISVMVASVGLFLFETRWLIPFLTHEKYFYGGNYAVIMTNPISGIFQKLLGPEQLS